ncbi:MAG: hypothetical protein FJY11_10410 [Bacteroidetes bacterium]|nr:hypothetical protein [Bacteroidota bacterium]
MKKPARIIIHTGLYASAGYQVSGIRYQVAGGRWQVSGGRHPGGFAAKIAGEAKRSPAPKVGSSGISDF